MLKDRPSLWLGPEAAAVAAAALTFSPAAAAAKAAGWVLGLEQATSHFCTPHCVRTVQYEVPSLCVCMCVCVCVCMCVCVCV